MPQKRVLILQPIDSSGVQALLDANIDVLHAPNDSRETLLAMVRDVDGLIVRTTSYRVDAEVMDRAPNMRVVGRHGVGVDNIDVDAARSRGIAVVNTPVANSQTVAEYTVGLMLSVGRFIPQADESVRQGRWGERDNLVGIELAESTLGIIGLGRIGSRVARICSLGFGMRAIYYDIVRKHEHEGTLGVEFASFDDVVRTADILTLHVPLTSQTRDMMNADRLSRMKKGAILINASRGPVVDIDALAERLATDRLAGAGIDVFPDEPLSVGHTLLTSTSVVVSPHMAAASRPSLIKMSLVAEDVVRVLTGEEPSYSV